MAAFPPAVSLLKLLLLLCSSVVLAFRPDSHRLLNPLNKPHVRPSPSPSPSPPPAVQIEKPLYAGYVPISSKEGSALYYAYWEASAAEAGVTDSTPILLWLQGGPGCASTFGAMYELGPSVVNKDGKPQPNPYAFNRFAGLLVIDQPIGTGYSKAGQEDDIPTDMLGMASDLYEGLYGFFESHPELRHRPFFITGESYAGKYIPSITHYILQADSNVPWMIRETSDLHKQSDQPVQQEQGCSTVQQLVQQLSSSSSQSDATLLLPVLRRSQLRRCPGLLRHRRQLKEDVPAPNFNLSGIAIGNGLTCPLTQTLALPSVIYNMGLITEATRTNIQQQVEVVIDLIHAQQWQQAADMRSKLIEFIEEASGVATLLDIRRVAAYDSRECVQQLLNSSEVKALMNADMSVDYSSCSPVVESVLKADTMKSAKVLVEDILSVLPVLLYQGQFDAQDGIASTNAWLSSLDWAYSRDFAKLAGELWLVDDVAAGWQRNISTLTQVVIRNAGHMVPRDQPQAALQLMQTWVQQQLQAAEEVAIILQSTHIQQQQEQQEQLWQSQGANQPQK